MTKTEELRRQKGLSIRALALTTGLSHSTISRIEKGQRKISTSQAVALSKFFKVPIEYLLGVEPHDEPTTTGEPRQPLRRLAAFRARYNVTTTYLGRILHLDPSMLTHFEKGRKSFSVESLKRACDYMGVTADYLLEQPPEAMLSRFITSCMELLNSGEAQRLSPITAKKLTVIGLMGELDALDGQTQTDILNKILQTLGDE